MVSVWTQEKKNKKGKSLEVTWIRLFFLIVAGVTDWDFILIKNL